MVPSEAGPLSAGVATPQEISRLLIAMRDDPYMSVSVVLTAWPESTFYVVVIYAG